MRQKYTTVFLATLLLLYTANEVRAQGCSDAGFCTIDSLKLQGNQRKDSDYRNTFKFGFLHGTSDNDIMIYGGYLEYTRNLHEKLNLNAKLNFLAQDGEQASSAGPSDVYISTSILPSDSIVLTAGVKLPLDDGNRMKNNLSLPMDFQPSLGTVDLIFGFGYGIQNFDLTVALQQPVTQNDNGFLPGDYPPDSGFDDFHPTNGYQRKGDILIRASYAVALGRKWTLTPSLLPIFHLAEDEYTNEEGIMIPIEGSSGLTLNANVFMEYSIDGRNTIEFGFGAPITTRETRPDGLTRHYVVSVEYKLGL